MLVLVLMDEEETKILKTVIKDIDILQGLLARIKAQEELKKSLDLVKADKTLCQSCHKEKVAYEFGRICRTCDTAFNCTSWN